MTPGPGTHPAAPEALAGCAELARLAEPPARAVLDGLWGGSIALVLSHLRRTTKRPFLVITPDAEVGDEFEDDLDAWQDDRIHHFPAWDVLPHEADHIEFDTQRAQVQALRALARHRSGASTGAPLVIAPVTALLQPVIPPSELQRGELTVANGQELAPEALCGLLAEAGFERVASVDGPGQFARRGGIVDAYPFAADEPYRIDFFGDVVDTVHAFDVVSQRNETPLETCILVDLSTQGVRNAYRHPEEAAVLPAHLPPDGVIVFLDPARCAQLAALYAEGFPPPSPILSYPDACKHLAGHCTWAIPPVSGDEWPPEWPGRKDVKRYAFDVISLTRLEGTLEHALAAVRELVEQETRVTLFCHNEAARSRCREVLLEAGGGLAGIVELALGRLSHSFHWPRFHWAVIADHEVFHRYHQRRRVRRRTATSAPIREFTELRPEDYVVHLLHGIARYRGLTRLEQNGQENDYLTLQFAEEQRLYVPLSHIDLVQRYIGGRGARPDLSKLGGKAWSRKKAQAEKAVREAAADLLRIQAVRAASPGIAYPEDDDWMRKFEDEFLYSETVDQLAAIGEIKKDMESGVPMDRLLCGDVGFGKTELAIRAAFKAVLAGRQVAVLVPTTILAEQHYRTFAERTADYPVRVECLSRFRRSTQQRRILSEAREGQVDILVGTHRLLSNDVSFADLGLIIIDEEQRFGVEHKERLKHLRAWVDVLTMTATPIPRTLHMGLLGLRDISMLATPPQDRQAIRTQVVRHREELIRRAILRELARNGQVFFVHNRVQTIEAVATQLAGLVPEARLGIAHGQMPEGELETVMLTFLNHRIDVLVATTIIESGLDIPNANTIFINNADHFGLAELHQLRGRVGRYRNRAYAYFLVPAKRPLSPIGQKRLRAIQEFAELGAGFNLALRDLEIRGAGNILGLEQSGHIHQVGYDLYCRLLEKVVHELKGEPWEEPEPVQLELGAPAYVPEDYINLDAERLRLYRDLAACRNAEELEALQASLRDRWGAPPDCVAQLFADEGLRQRARAVGINFLGRRDRALLVGVRPDQAPAVATAMREYKVKGRRFSHVEADRYRFGLGYYEDEYEGYHRELCEALLLRLSQTVERENDTPLQPPSP